MLLFNACFVWIAFASCYSFLVLSVVSRVSRSMKLLNKSRRKWRFCSVARGMTHTTERFVNDYYEESDSQPERVNVLSRSIEEREREREKPDDETAG